MLPSAPRQGDEPFENVERITVLRGGGIGDLLGAFPALEALGEAYPSAPITLLTTPLLAALLEGRPAPVARVLTVPTFPQGSQEDGRTWRQDPATVQLVETLRSEAIDLAVQLHGGGRNSNPFTLALGARHTVGCATPDAAPLERQLPHAYYQREVDRWLEVAALAGAPAASREPRFPAVAEDHAAAAPWLQRESRGLVVVHPGATDPRRRWPAERFARVAAALATEGWQIVVVGDPGEREVAEAVASEAARQAPGTAALVSSAAGRTNVHALVGLLAAARLVVANDSGPRHLAQALGTPTASVYWGPNLVNAGPTQRLRHRVQISWRQLCPVCGADGTDPLGRSCPHEEPWVAEVPVDGVLADARNLLAGQ